MNKDIEKVKQFLINNGWNIDNDDSDFDAYFKDGNMGFNIDNEEIVLIGDIGDFYHIKIESGCYYHLLGYMIHHRLIAIDFKTY